MTDAQKGRDPLSFEAMRQNREMWEFCQVDEYTSLVRSSSATVGAAITTRTRLEALLLSLLAAASTELDLPKVRKALAEKYPPKLAIRISLCGEYQLVHPDAIQTMRLLKDIGNAFAHDGVISAIEPAAALLFDSLRAEMKIAENRNAADDVRLIEKAFARCVASIRDWRNLPSGA